jgi:dephospho-CoA kinase
MRVGLTGGIGAGKTEVAGFFSEFGAFVIDTDVLAREAVAPMSDGLLAIARTWPEVVRENSLDRAALARIVFADDAQRARLNAILHPHIRRLAVEREAAAAPGQMIVHVVPLLFETDYARLVDKTVLVTAPEQARLKRTMARDRTDEANVRARMHAQLTPEDARSRADYVIDNDGDLAQLKLRTRAVYDALAGPLRRNG